MIAIRGPYETPDGGLSENTKPRRASGSLRTGTMEALARQIFMGTEDENGPPIKVVVAFRWLVGLVTAAIVAHLTWSATQLIGHTQQITELNGAIQTASKEAATKSDVHALEIRLSQMMTEKLRGYPPQWIQEAVKDVKLKQTEIEKRLNALEREVGR